MYTQATLGVASSGFLCSANGTCSGVSNAMTEVFMDLQKQINRVGVRFGITKLDTDGRLGPTTLRAMINLVTSLSRQLGTNLDRSLEDLIIEVGTPTSTRDLALNAEALTEALKRDGSAEAPWSILTAVKDVAAQIIASGSAPPTPAIDASSVVNPNQTTTVVPPALPTPSAITQAATAAAASAASWIQPAAGPPVPTWMLVAGGVGLVAVVGGIAAAFASRKPRGAAVAGVRRRRGLGCSCAKA